MSPTSSRFDEIAQDSTFSSIIGFEKLKRKVVRNRLVQALRHGLHIPPPSIHSPIFIVGTIRSGATLLANCLGEHPSIVYLGYELTSEWCDLAGIEIARSRNNKAQCPPYTELDATNTLCNRVRHGFAHILGQNGGSRTTRLLDKNPHLWNKLPFLRNIFPDATLIITSRDIRSTVASMKQLWLKQNRKSEKKVYFPRNPKYCWGVITPASPDDREASRVFPGGDVGALAEYWLHTYEMIEKTIEGFNPPVLVKHRDFISRPYEVLAEIYDAVNVPPIKTSLPTKLDPSRNDRWAEILTSQEQTKLQAFIESHRSRIERLKYADTTL